ncbi:MAG: AAA family ATPase, partial [Sedimenticolaceae bacterium]
FAIIDCDAPEEVLRERIIGRAQKEDNVSDADLAVLRVQLNSREPLSEEEFAFSLPVRPDRPLDHERLVSMVKTKG